MKKLMNITLTMLLILAFSPLLTAQTGIDVRGETGGVNERPAIENLIEVWSPGEDYSSNMINLTNGFEINVFDTKLTNSGSGSEDLAFDDDQSDADDLGNEVEVAELEIKASIIYEDSRLILYPNPAQNEINISLRDSDIQVIEIYSVSGALIYRCANGADAMQNVQIDLQSTARGVYMIHVTSQNGVSTKKFALR